MARFLIKPDDSPNNGVWKGATFVRVEEDGYEWGNKEGPPNFYRINVPGVAKEDAVQYLEEWRHMPVISILQQDLQIDTYRLRLTSDRVSLTGKNAFSEIQIGGFFSDWGATNVVVTNASVTFDISVYDAITSPRFWDADDLTGVVFVETLFNSSTGDHLVEVQDSPFSVERMRAAVLGRGGAVVPPNSFVMNRSAARQRLMDDIEERISNIRYANRHWYIKASGMAALQAAGGELTITPTQFLNNVADGLEE